MRPSILSPLLFLAACGTPGVLLQPQDADFAFLEVQLRG